MAERYVITKSKMDALAQSINAKSGTTGPKTIAEMQNAVDNLSTGAGLPDGGQAGQILTKEELAAFVAENVPLVKTAEQPTFVEDIAQCTDTSKVYVLPNGHLAAYRTTKTTTEGSSTPNFTNLFDTSKGAMAKNGYRFSLSANNFAEQSTDCAIAIPVGAARKRDQGIVIRAKGATKVGARYFNSIFYGDYDGSTFSNTGGGSMLNESIYTESNGLLTITWTPNANDHLGTYTWVIFIVATGADPNNLIVTIDQEITYTTIPGGTEVVSKWEDTGIEYNQPPDYAVRVSNLEAKAAQLRVDVDALASKGGSTTAKGLDVFALPAYPPTPQIPGDGSAEADFDVSDVATADVYAYMDKLAARYKTYMAKQYLGKDSSGKYDYYRYIFSTAYWRAWYKEGYPQMYAWKNGATVAYSVSVSPRIGDTMYTTPYIGTEYAAVTAVNCETIGVPSTRTVNGLVFERYSEGDVLPTIVYTVPFAISGSYKGRTYTSSFAGTHSISEYADDYIVDSQGTKFYRYPFLDKKLDKTGLFPIFILANEHGNHGDSMIPCVTVLRMLKDLCSTRDNLFLSWIRENAVLTVIPLGNPHGSYNNANRVNINRNYDTPGWAGSNDDPQGGTKAEGAFGPYAGSEIETQYIMNTIQQCKPKTAMSCHGRGIPSGTLNGPYNSAAHFQGCGFSAERMWRVEEALFSMYNFGFTPSHHTITDDSSNNYLNAGKSPSYIEYAGAVGGLIEIDDFEVGSLNLYTPLAMEQAYAEVLLVLQNWVREALEKEGSL